MNQQTDDTVVVNIMIIPPQEVREAVMLISRSLAADQLVFGLSNERPAHMTVFRTRFHKADLRDVVGGTAKSVAGRSHFRLQHTGYCRKENRYLEATYQKTPGFTALQSKIVQNISKFRANPGDPTREAADYGPYTKAQLRYVTRTGYDFLGALSNSHITLARYKEDAMSAAFPALPEAQLSFDAAEIAVCVADYPSAAYQFLESFTLCNKSGTSKNEIMPSART